MGRKPKKITETSLTIRYGNKLQPLDLGGLSPPAHDIVVGLIGLINKRKIPDDRKITVTAKELYKEGIVDDSLLLQNNQVIINRFTEAEEYLNHVIQIKKVSDGYIRDRIYLFSRCRVKTDTKGKFEYYEIVLNSENLDVFRFIAEHGFVQLNFSTNKSLLTTPQKELYRMLCNFRTAGEAIIPDEELRLHLKIPRSQPTSKITERIIKPMINNENIQREFEDITFKKQYGGDWIFTFKPQKQAAMDTEPEFIAYGAELAKIILSETTKQGITDHMELEQSDAPFMDETYQDLLIQSLASENSAIYKIYRNIYNGCRKNKKLISKIIYAFSANSRKSEHTLYLIYIYLKAVDQKNITFPSPDMVETFIDTVCILKRIKAETDVKQIQINQSESKILCDIVDQYAKDNIIKKACYVASREDITKKIPYLKVCLENAQYNSIGRNSAYPDSENQQQTAEDDEMIHTAEQLLDDFNQICSTDFKVDDKSILKPFIYFLKQGRTPEEIRIVIKNRYDYFMEKKMKSNLIPSIILKPERFSEYLQTGNSSPSMNEYPDYSDEMYAADNPELDPEMIRMVEERLKELKEANGR